MKKSVMRTGENMQSYDKFQIVPKEDNMLIGSSKYHKL